ncbi:MAG: LTA synthase family protein [Alistipes sp.]|nr:LTA synthase family protein [Alistipes sp.]
MRRLSHTRLAIIVWRIVMLYATMQLCHAIFYLYNADLVGEITAAEIGQLWRGSLLFDNASIIYSMLLFLILSALPIPDRWWNSRVYRTTLFATYIIPAAVVVAANMGDTVYFHYTQKRCTADELFFADNDNTAELMLQFMWENMHLVLLALAIIALLAWGYRRSRHAEELFDGIILQSISRILLLLFVVFCSIVGIRGGMTRMTRPITMSNAMLYTQSPAKANMILSNPFCIIRTLSGSVTVPEFFEEEELKAIYTPSHYPAEYHSEMFGRYEGYNVVLFILESFSAEHSAYLLPEEHTGEGYTPNLDRVMSEGLCFSRCYANGATSIAAPPTIWSSTPSYETPFMLMSESLAECRPMPRILADKGYDTAFFCGSERGSMGFGAYARMTGIERLYSMEDYAARYSMADFDGKWGIWDEPFMKFMGEELTELQQPFFATIFTLTSHHPFIVPDEVRDELPAGTTLNHRPVAYSDRALGRFMEQCRQESWFENTLFVFVADHVSSERMAERTLHSPGCFHIVGCIYAGDGSLRGEYDSIMSQTDFMPTILGLVGNDEPYFAIGRDIFNEPWREPFTLIRSGYGYVGLSDDYVVDFDGCDILGVYGYDDVHRERNIATSADVENIEKMMKATLQSYYTHVEARNYAPDVE